MQFLKKHILTSSIDHVYKVLHSQYQNSLTGTQGIPSKRSKASCYLRKLQVPQDLELRFVGRRGSHFLPGFLLCRRPSFVPQRVTRYLQWSVTQKKNTEKKKKKRNYC